MSVTADQSVKVALTGYQVANLRYALKRIHGDCGNGLMTELDDGDWLCEVMDILYGIDLDCAANAEDDIANPTTTGPETNPETNP